MLIVGLHYLCLLRLIRYLSLQMCRIRRWVLIHADLVVLLLQFILQLAQLLDDLLMVSFLGGQWTDDFEEA